MFRNIRFIRVLPIIIIVFITAGFLRSDGVADVLRFVLSLSLYSGGVFLIIWAFTSGKSKKAKDAPRDKKDEGSGKDQENL